MALVRFILALLAIPGTFLWILLLPGGLGARIPMPWGLISYAMVIAIPATGFGQFVYPRLTPFYLVLLFGPALVVLLLDLIAVVTYRLS